MRIRQVVLVAEDLEARCAQIKALFGIEESFRDPPDGGLGIVNAVMPIGETFLEVVSPMRDDATARRYLDNVGGDGGYMVIVQYPEFATARARAEAAGARFVWKIDFPDQHQWHLHPKDVGGAIVALDWSDPPARWRWAGDDWPEHVRTDVVSGITGVHLSAPDPAELSQRWSTLLGGELSAAHPDAPVLTLGQSKVTFARWDRPYARMTGIDLSVSDKVELFRRAERLGVAHTPDSLTLAGVVFSLV